MSVPVPRVKDRIEETIGYYWHHRSYEEPGRGDNWPEWVGRGRPDGTDGGGGGKNGGGGPLWRT